MTPETDQFPLILHSDAWGWTGVQNAGERLNVDYDIGEFHITAGGQTLYCGGNEKWSDFTGKDIYVLHRTADGMERTRGAARPHQYRGIQ